MFENKTMKVIGKILLWGIIAYVIFLLLDQRGKLSIQPEAQQEYVTASIDSTISLRQLNPNEIAVDTTIIPSLTALVAKVDSDSLLRYDLYRHQQAVVTIDLEEHKEHVFFTWDDIKAYFHGLLLTYEQYKSNKNNDHH